MTKNEAKKRIAQLKREIRRHGYFYHVKDAPEISDAAWDALKHELTEMERQYPEFITPDSPTQRVSGKPLPEFSKVTHKARQWSLSDAFSFDEVCDWEERNVKILQKTFPKITARGIDYVCELKIDGLHVALTYEKGMLKTAATRGDGVVGEDVTQNVKTVWSVPLRLFENSFSVIASEAKQSICGLNKRLLRRSAPRNDNSRTTCVDIVAEGEIWLSKEEFARINKKQKKEGKSVFANPRNAAAGSIRQLDSNVTADRKLNAFLYDLALSRQGLPKTQDEELRLLGELGFKVEPHYELCRTLAEVRTFLAKWEQRHDRLSYLVDGVVIKVNKREYQEILGYTGKSPRFALAYKFAPEETTTVIEDIVVQVGRLGRLTPVARFKPVVVAGTTVSRATLHNQAVIDKLDARIGDTVIIRKAGDIIPEVLQTLLRLRGRNARKFVMPAHCPVCGSDVRIERSGDSIMHFCESSSCSARNREQIAHFVSRRAMNIDGLGEKIIERFIDEGLIADEADIFTLQKGDMAALTGFGEKSSDNLFSSIDSSRGAPLSKFLYALGIPHIGERMAQTFSHFARLRGVKTLPSLWTVMNKVSREDIMTIPDFGPKAAESVYRWFQNARNEKLIRRLYEGGVRLTAEKGGGFSGKSFVFTGALASISRDDAKDMVISRGGVIGSSVSKDTDYAVVGLEPGGKFERAKALGIKIIDEAEFLRLVKGK